MMILVMTLIMLMMVSMGIHFIYAVGNGRVTTELNLRLGGRIADQFPESHNTGFDAEVVGDVLGQAQRRMTVVMVVCVSGAGFSFTAGPPPVDR